jgi:hypothetical protein
MTQNKKKKREIDHAASDSGMFYIALVLFLFLFRFSLYFYFMQGLGGVVRCVGFSLTV